MDPVGNILGKKKGVCDRCGSTDNVRPILLGTTNLCAKCIDEDEEMLIH